MGQLPENKGGGGSPQNLEAEKKKIESLANQVLKKNELWYIIDRRWYDQWKKYVENDGYGWESKSNTNLNPGPIDNTDIFTDETYEQMKDNLSEDVEFVMLPKTGWEYLVNTYGIVADGMAIERKVIEQGAFFKKCVIEIYPMQLRLSPYDNRKEVVKRNFSKRNTVGEIEEEVRKTFQIPEETPVKLWSAYLPTSLESLEKQKSVEDSALQPGQVVVFETKKDGKWMHTPTSTSVSSNSQNGAHKSVNTYGLRNTSPTRGRVTTAGLCGLNNLGNTCFMNSALQCLSNVPALCNYFLNETYKTELNKTNPLGMGGKLAKAYARLVQSIWSGEQSSFAPREFKMEVGRFAPRFSGYQQHDSQELLSFLVDGLHEDLNRISKKPYVEMKEADGRDDQLVAEESWSIHHLRNDSIIVDTLHGLFRSKVDCPECPRISVTFDPFCFISLPLPLKRQRTLECSFVPLKYDGKIYKYKVTVNKTGCIRDLCKAVSELTNVPSTEMAATDVYNSRFHKIFKPSEGINGIYEKDYIHVFQKPLNMTMVPVYMRHLSSSGPNPSAHLFGQPFLVPVDIRNTTYRQLYKTVLKATWRYIKDDELKSDVARLICDEDFIDDKAEEDDVDWIQPPVHQLFSLKVVNSFGTQLLRVLHDTDSPLDLSENTYITADWSYHVYEHQLMQHHWSDVSENHESMATANIRKANSGVQLHDCMRLFTTEEQLDKDDAWYCSDCKKHQQATKKFDLWMLPPVLIIHLKRFSYTRYSRDKLDTLVNFPTRDLDLSDFIVNPNKGSLPKPKRCYNLIAVSNHYGGLGGGHYTAYAKNHIDKQWHYFDDSSVSLSSEDRVVTKAAYMLVYQRQDLEAWLDVNPDKSFPYLEPIFSPRAMGLGGPACSAMGTSFKYDGVNASNGHQLDEDTLNNNNADDDMDTS
ncbi:ubiquitin carboxyl-terminal hydrolase 15 [Ciona intestinalis]